MKSLLDPSRIQDLTTLCRKLDLQLSNFDRLHQALTHTSYANEAKQLKTSHNERLEFLGDAVLELVISEYLYHQFLHFSEGELTKARAQIVCEPTLAECATRLDLGEYLLLGKGEENSGGRKRASILSDAFEAVVGAIYMEAGFSKAQAFILSHLSTAIKSVGQETHLRDYKTLLQEYVQRGGETKISYEVIRESGPDHNKVFEISVIVNNHILGAGTGKSKKEAEQYAAKEALIKLKVITDTNL